MVLGRGTFTVISFVLHSRPLIKSESDWLLHIDYVTSALVGILAKSDDFLVSRVYNWVSLLMTFLSQ